MSYIPHSPPGSPRMYTDRVVAEAKARDAAALAAAEAANSRTQGIIASEERVRSSQLSSLAAQEGQRASSARINADVEARQGLAYQQAGLADSARSRDLHAQADAAHIRGIIHSSNATILNGHSADASHLSHLESSLGHAASARSVYAPTYLHSHLDRTDAAFAYERSSACAAEAAVLRSSADAHLSSASLSRAEAANASAGALSASTTASRNFSNADNAHRSAERLRLESTRAELAAADARTGAVAAGTASARAEVAADLSAQASANAQSLASVCSAQADIDSQLAANYETACTRRALSNSQSPQRFARVGSPLVTTSPVGSPYRTSLAGSPHRDYLESPLKGSPHRQVYY